MFDADRECDRDRLANTGDSVRTLPCARPMLATPVIDRSRGVGNRLLAVLEAHDLRRLQPACTRVRLTRGDVLLTPGASCRYAYFQVRGIIELLATTADGETVQVGLVGSDGVVGLPTVLHEGVSPFQLVVPIAGEAYRVPVSTVLAEVRRHARFQQALLQHAHQQVTHMAHAAVCHRFHTVLQRLCVWLLTAADRTSADTLDVTQDLLAQLLGAHRTAVSVAATALQDRGVIRQRHARVQILQRAGLRARACSCYGSVVDLTAPIIR
jgi:CRP-like cAMP-binding protein